MPTEVKNRNTLPYTATASLEATFADGYTIRGTAAIVGENDVLTATHMVYDPDHGGYASSIELYPGADYNDKLNSYQDTPFQFSFKTGEWNVVAWPSQTYRDSDNNTLLLSESQYDMAVIGLNSDVGNQIGGWFKLDAGYDSAQYAYSLGYPANSTGMMLARTWITKEEGVYASYSGKNGDLMGRGSSGGPLYIFKDGNPYLIGIKSSGTNGVSNYWADIGLLYPQILSAINANDKLLHTASVTDDYASTISTQGLLVLNQALTGTIETLGDSDWFKVELIAGLTYRFTLTGTNNLESIEDPALRLLDANGRELDSNDDIILSVNKNAQIDFNVITSGAYYLEASGYQNTTGAYILLGQQIPDDIAPSITRVVAEDRDNPNEGVSVNIYIDTQASGVPVNPEITVYFNELIKAGSGSISITDTSGATIEHFDVATSSLITINGTKLTLTPGQPLANNHDYFIVFSAGAITDHSGNAYVARDNYQFSTAAVPIYGTDKKDNLSGSQYADSLYGLAGKDRLQGKAGDDYLDGGKGADIMIGGDGNDTYVIDNAGDKITETGANDDNDTVISWISYALGKNLENLILEGNKKINGTGNNLDNSLYGNAKNNVLKGRAGDDNLFGGEGKDILTGGTGADWFIFDTALSNSNIDTITDFARGTDTLVLDSLIFSQFNGQSSDFISVAKLATAGNALSGQHVIYERTTNTLYYDEDGAGTGNSAQAFVKLTGVTNLDIQDIFLY